MKKIILLFFVTLGSLGLASCHGRLIDSNYIGDDLFEVPAEFDTTKNHEITFWAKNDNNKIQIQIYENAIKAFEKIYPNIDVEISHYYSYPDIYEDVLMNIPTKTTPNVCIAYPDHVAAYKEGQNVVLKLDTLMTDEKYGLGGSDVRFKSPKVEDFVPKYLAEGLIYDTNSITLESYYTIPFQRSTECLYVNKTWLEEHGFAIPEVFTWEYMWEICQYAYENKTGKMIPMIYKSVDNMFIQLCKQNDYKYTTPDGDILFNNIGVKKMLNELNNYATKYYFNSFDNASYPGNSFNLEQCIFAIDSTAGATWIGSNAPLMDVKEVPRQFETLVTTLPQVDVNEIQVISQGPSLSLFNKTDEQEVLASWLFLQFLLTNEVQIDYTKTEGYAPVTKTAMESEEFKTYLNDPSEYSVKIAATKNTIQNKENSFVSPAFNGSAIVRKTGGWLINAVINQKNLTNGKLDDLIKRALADCGVK